MKNNNINYLIKYYDLLRQFAKKLKLIKDVNKNIVGKYICTVFVNTTGNFLVRYCVENDVLKIEESIENLWSREFPYTINNSFLKVDVFVSNPLQSINMNCTIELKKIDVNGSVLASQTKFFSVSPKMEDWKWTSSSIN